MHQKSHSGVKPCDLKLNYPIIRVFFFARVRFITFRVCVVPFRYQNVVIYLGCGCWGSTCAHLFHALITLEDTISTVQTKQTVLPFPPSNQTILAAMCTLLTKHVQRKTDIYLDIIWSKLPMTFARGTRICAVRPRPFGCLAKDNNLSQKIIRNIYIFVVWWHRNCKYMYWHNLFNTMYVIGI